MNRRKWMICIVSVAVIMLGIGVISLHIENSKLTYHRFFVENHDIGEQYVTTNKYDLKLDFVIDNMVVYKGNEIYRIVPYLKSGYMFDVSKKNAGLSDDQVEFYDDKIEYKLNQDKTSALVTYKVRYKVDRKISEWIIFEYEVY